MARLEAVAAKLEATQIRLVGSGSSAAAAAAAAVPLVPAAARASTAAAPSPAAPASGSASSALGSYQALLSGPLAATLDAAEAVGGEVLKATRVLAEGFRREAAGGRAVAPMVCAASSEMRTMQASSDKLRLLVSCHCLSILGAVQNCAVFSCAALLELLTPAVKQVMLPQPALPPSSAQCWRPCPLVPSPQTASCKRCWRPWASRWWRLATWRAGRGGPTSRCELSGIGMCRETGMLCPVRHGPRAP